MITESDPRTETITSADSNTIAEHSHRSGHQFDVRQNEERSGLFARQSRRNAKRVERLEVHSRQVLLFVSHSSDICLIVAINSTTGKRLMSKCRLLYQENEELGKMIESGRIAKLEGELALQKNFCKELEKSQSGQTLIAYVFAD